MKQLIHWASAAIVVSIMFMTVYVVGQQILRQSANEPQTYMAQLAAAQLDRGIAPDSLVQPKLAIDHSLVPFIVIYKLDGSVAASQATLRGAAPIMPIGVLHHADNATYHTITWQPASDVRLASVTVRAKSYYVVTVRSLHDIEHRIDLIGLLVTFGWLASMITLAAAYSFHRKYKNP
jgi:hypothetical protein